MPTSGRLKSTPPPAEGPDWQGVLDMVLRHRSHTAAAPQRIEEQAHETLCHAFERVDDVPSSLMVLLQLVRRRPAADEQFVRAVLTKPQGSIPAPTAGTSEPRRPLPEAYRCLQQQALQQGQRALRLPESIEPHLLQARLTALEACLGAMGGRCAEVHAQLKSLMRLFLGASMLAEASLMAVELYCGQGHLDVQEDQSLVAAAAGLFAHVPAVGDASARAILATTAARVLEAFAQGLPEAQRPPLQQAAAEMRTLLNLRPSLQSPDDRLQWTVHAALKLVTGPLAPTVRARVQTQLSELQLGASESRGSARIWLRHFVTLVTGHDADDEATLEVLERGLPCPLFDVHGAVAATRLCLQDATARRERVDSNLAHVHHAPQAVALLKLWCRDMLEQAGPHMLALHGPSGTGKSTLATQLAQSLFDGPHIASCNLGACQTALELCGTPLGILSARPGPIASALMGRRGGQAVLLLDEVDKAPAALQNIVASATEFTEPFRDSYFDFPIYLHALFVIGTYNSAQTLVPHLLDRLAPQAIYVPPLESSERRLYMRQFLNEELALRHRSACIVSDSLVRFIEEGLPPQQSLRALRGHAKRLAQVVQHRKPEVGAEALTAAHVSEALGILRVTQSRLVPPETLPAALRLYDWSRYKLQFVVPRTTALSTLQFVWTTRSHVFTVTREAVRVERLRDPSCGHAGACGALVRVEQQLMCISTSGQKTTSLQGWRLKARGDFSLYCGVAPVPAGAAHFLRPLDNIYWTSALAVDVSDCMLI